MSIKPIVPQKVPLREIDWVGLLPLIVEANRALAQYHGVLFGVPDPKILLSPMTTQEAVLSSKIEGTVTTLDKVLRYEAGEEIGEENKRQDIQEVINYRRALILAEKELNRQPFTLNMMLKLHEVLLDSVRGRDKGRGRFRTVQNWIGLPGSTPEQAEFIPPEPLLIKDYLDNWEKYYHADEKDPLVQLAVLHAQFEIIHPFVDGNGRIGRIIIPLFLYEKKLLPRPMLYISGYFESHRDQYAGNLRALNGPESWNNWISFFLTALLHQAGENTKKACGILDLYRNLKERILHLTHSQYAIPLLDEIFRNPIFTPTVLMKSKLMPSRQMMMALIRRLQENNIIKVIVPASGRRPQILALAELINLCEGRKVIK
jgi:Fic family protein